MQRRFLDQPGNFLLRPVTIILLYESRPNRPLFFMPGTSIACIQADGTITDAGCTAHRPSDRQHLDPLDSRR